MKKTLKKFLRRKNRKNRKNKTKKYRKGGKINHDVASPVIHKLTVEIPNSEIEFAKEKLVEGFEYCGKYVTSTDISRVISGDKCVLTSYDVTPGPLVEASEGASAASAEATKKPIRGSCLHKEKELYSILWHTHPNHLKFYPSVEDITTVKKLRRGGVNIKLSVIYSSIGIWLLEALDNDISQEQTKYMDEINARLYHFQDNHGRNTTLNFNLSNVVGYIKNVYCDEMFEYCKMNIIFEPYTKGQQITLTLDNVRADSLTP